MRAGLRAAGLAGLTALLLAGCAEEARWRPAADGCVLEAEEPPLRRVVNYVDPTLCGRPKADSYDVRKSLREALEE